MTDAVAPKAVLVVDDEPALRRVLGLALSRKGFRIIEAENGTHAFEIASTTSVQLVISDVRMPNGDGFSLLARLRTLAAPPKVVLVTGFADLTEADAIRMGAVALLAKPFDFKRIVALATEMAS